MDVVIWVVLAVFVVSSTISALVVTLGLRPVHAARTEVDRRWSALLDTLDERRTRLTVLAEGADPQERAALDDALAAARRSRLPRSRAEAEADLHRAARPLLARDDAGAAQVAARARLDQLDQQAAERRREHDAAVDVLQARVSRFPGSLLAPGSAPALQRLAVPTASLQK